MKKAVLALSMMFMSTMANALSLDVQDGQLMGASGVNVSGKLYDVSFVEGTCIEVFSGCDENSDFLFGGDRGLADLASQALVDQVFIDGPLGLFGTHAELTNGISDTAYGFVLTGSSAGSNAGGAVAIINSAGYAPNPGQEIGSFIYWSGADTADFSGARTVWGVWSAAEVPAPATLVLLLTGLFGILGMRRSNMAQ